MTFDQFHREHVAQAWREWNPPDDLPKWESAAHFIAFVRKRYKPKSTQQAERQQGMTYQDFIKRKTQIGTQDGFKPVFMPDWLFDFQKHIVEWSVQQGRAAIFADCGMGKTPMQLVWAENVVRHTNKRVLILTPLAVSYQTHKESEKFGISTYLSRNGEKKDGIVITNYEQLHKFDPNDYSGVVCDESSILKSYSGKTRKLITRFISKHKYRLLCTATAAPNDYVELGTSSEALGGLSYSDMLKMFFKYLDDKGQKKELAAQKRAEKAIEYSNGYYQKLSYRVSQSIGQWRLKHHAVVPFWKWVASWAMACRKPSDLGFDDSLFILPELIERDHIITPNTPPEGMLFNLPAFGRKEELQERRRTLNERCEYVKNLVDHNRQAVVWCHLNPEGDLLSELIKDSEQVKGLTPDEKKIEIYNDFSSGNIRVLVIKPKIGAWGLNWQHCNHVVTFASHSYEQYYQLTRRCWRFGQKETVTVDVVATEGEKRVLTNMREKAKRVDTMFQSVVSEMNSSKNIERQNKFTLKTEVPSWL